MSVERGETLTWPVGAAEAVKNTCWRAMKSKCFGSRPEKRWAIIGLLLWRSILLAPPGLWQAAGGRLTGTPLLP